MGPRSSVQFKMQAYDAETILQLIKLHEEARNKTLGLFNRYMFKNIPIQTRKVEDITKLNNKLVNNFRGYVVDQVVGYLFGTDIAYTVDKAAENTTKETYQRFKNKLDRYLTINETADLDSELAKYMAICGYAARLQYVDTSEKNEIRTMNLPAWEVFFVFDGLSMTHAVRYQYYDTPLKKDALSVTIYTDSQKYIFEEDATKGLILKEEKTHGFDFIPVALFQNNAEEMGDFEKVENLIDAYDIITSDSVNEVESFAHAYMLFKNINIDEKTMKEFKKTGGIQVDGEDGDVKFITKDINDTFMENVKKTLVRDIHKFSASIDMADESFSGSAQSGESRKWKMMDLETKAANKQRKFEKGLRQQFKIICSAWQKEIPGIDYLNISWVFTRNTPQDLTYIADFAQKMNGIHSRQTLLDKIPYIDDSEYEMELMKKERDEFGGELEKPEYDFKDVKQSIEGGEKE